MPWIPVTCRGGLDKLPGLAHQTINPRTLGAIKRQAGGMV